MPWTPSPDAEDAAVRSEGQDQEDEKGAARAPEGGVERGEAGAKHPFGRNAKGAPQRSRAGDEDHGDAVGPDGLAIHEAMIH